ncbi:MAG: PD40 domain-containing protein [Proteobacteria bacterium]|jgi:tricorn protease|nr:PD40 domain-containing protein [Pseudomonadota bacterium]MBS1949484.1 PD40 domain-containing protein [Bacteroidota bacterium]MBS1982510.1 PD40 domain-containing protein [Bacteroidota bacterium]WHZ09050.1 MAG: S41 family peptidase [Cytophagales bacterium]
MKLSIHFFLVFVFGISANLFAIDTKDTRLLRLPAVSASHIAFIYAEDLWIANLDGTQPRRLTVDEGIESNPHFSPDGKWIAFNAEYDGNTDVFIIPAEGGVPTRLTWHPGADLVRGFTPDGKNVLFASQRTVFTNRYHQLFTVPVSGGFPTQIEIPNAWNGTLSPDGKKLAYSPLSPAHNQWKHYRGGNISTIWIFSFDDKSAIKIPQPNTGCNDSDPMWVGNTIYFRSDRDGEFNLYAYDVTSNTITAITKFTDFPVLSAGSGGGNIVIEQAGYLHLITAGGSPKKLTIGLAADLQDLRPRFVKGAGYIRSAAISPTGARAVFDFRGEIITVPAEKGDARNITQSTGAHEKYPAWSPDGKSIAYFSDASGEYELYIKPQDGNGDARKIKLTGAGFYAYPQWSPDGKKIAYVDNSRSLFVLDVVTGVSKKIDSDEVYTPGVFRDLLGSWSNDSKWIAYDKLTETNFKRIYLYSVDQNKSFAVTDGLSDASEPKLDPSGKYLYFFASTDAGPVVNWFDQSNNDMRATSAIYLVTLQKSTLSPLAKESDEESAKNEKPEAAAGNTKSKSPKADAEEPKQSEALRMDWDGIDRRIIDLPIKAGNFALLSVGMEGEIFYVEFPTDGSGFGKLHKYDLGKRKDTEVTDVDEYVISSDKKKMLYRRGNSYTISTAGENPEGGKGMLNTGGIQVKIDPQAEWLQTFNEAWRINRDYFYDPGMHGADWVAMKKKYEQFLPHLSCRSDLNAVIQWMCSELAVGHHRLSGSGDRVSSAEQVAGGLLGADYTLVNNRYQIKKIYGGLNWNPELRSPLTEPGINAQVGEYILAVNGKEVSAPQSIYSFFENTSGKIVELTIGPNPAMTGSRVVKVVPVANENALRNRDWVEGNLKKVTEATNAQVAYVYVPNTADAGHEYFKRYFYPQANRKAIIVDERFNGGGQIANYYIELLQQPYQSHWATRYGKDFKTPSASIQGPKVMIINETAGSGGDMLPWMFRKFKVGTLVGKRTWGGLVGILGFPEFIDGATVTAPNVGIWTKDGFIVENVGVPPDIEVEQTPSEVIKGNDPQLQKAIEVALDELKKNPPEEYKRPPFPIRVKN